MGLETSRKRGRTDGQGGASYGSPGTGGWRGGKAGGAGAGLQPPALSEATVPLRGLAGAPGSLPRRPRPPASSSASAAATGAAFPSPLAAAAPGPSAPPAAAALTPLSAASSQLSATSSSSILIPLRRRRQPAPRACARRLPRACAATAYRRPRLRPAGKGRGGVRWAPRMRGAPLRAAAGGHVRRGERAAERPAARPRPLAGGRTGPRDGVGGIRVCDTRTPPARFSTAHPKPQQHTKGISSTYRSTLQQLGRFGAFFLHFGVINQSSRPIFSKSGP